MKVKDEKAYSLSSHPITCIKGCHSGLSPRMQQGASSPAEGMGPGPEVSARMGVEETQGSHRAHLRSWTPGRGALGRYPRQVVPDSSWCQDQPHASDGLAVSCLRTKAAGKFNISSE